MDMTGLRFNGSDYFKIHSCLPFRGTYYTGESNGKENEKKKGQWDYIGDYIG